MKTIAKLGLVALLAGCAPRFGSWEYAEKLESPTAYAWYIRENPKGKYVEEARVKQEQSYLKLYGEARYLEEFPNGKHAAEIKAKIAKEVEEKRKKEAAEKQLRDNSTNLEAKIFIAHTFHAGQPAWDYTVTFTEKNGIGARITHRELKIPEGGGFWTDYGYGKDHFKDIDNIRIGPKGTGTYKSWVSGKRFIGHPLQLNFIGYDDKLHKVDIRVSAILTEENK